jgi:hypothetical protein
MYRKHNNTSLPRTEQSSTFIGYVYSLGVAVVLFFLCFVHLSLINYDTPLDYNEAAMTTVTATIISNENPHSYQNQPSRTSVYPLLYNIAIAPTALVFGNSLGLHRVISAIFVILSCYLCFIALRKNNVTASHSWAATSIIYAALLYYSTPIAGPNSLGVLFFLGVTLLPWLDKFSDRSIIIASLLGILAFYTKQYFVAGLGFLYLYLFLYVSYKKSVIYGFCTAILLIASVFAVHYASPYYFDMTFFAVKNATLIVSSYKRLAEQLFFFLCIYSPLWAALILVFFKNQQYINKVFSSKKIDAVKYETRHGGGVLPLKFPIIDYFWFCFICSTLVIVVSLGKNLGNYMSYLFQLMSPFFILATFSTVKNSGLRNSVLVPITIATLFFSASILPRDFNTDNSNWEALEKLVIDNEHIYASPLALDIMRKNNKIIYQNGHTRYFGFADWKHEFFKQQTKFPSINDIWESYVTTLYTDLEKKKFDVLILDPFTNMPNSFPFSPIKREISGKELLLEHYQISTKIKVSLGNRRGAGSYVLSIWTRK